MKVGIVGNEAKKFTPETEAEAKDIIRSILKDHDSNVTEVCSGECPLGGIDIWAKEIAQTLGVPFTPFPPRENNWSNGYRPRNLQIAHWSDKIYNILVDKLPPTYVGMKFEKCYHCAKAGRNAFDHVKSGGCWTALEAIKLGKQSEWIIIPSANISNQT